MLHSSKLLDTGYFPRNLAEARSQPELIPEDLGDEWGEFTSFERSVSITAGPRPLSTEKPIDPSLLEKLKRNEKLLTGNYDFKSHDVICYDKMIDMI